MNFLGHLRNIFIVISPSVVLFVQAAHAVTKSMKTITQNPNNGGHRTLPSITLTGDETRKYAALLLMEGGFSPEAAKALLANADDPSTTDQYLTPAKTAALLACSTRHLRNLKRSGAITPAIQRGNQPLYSRSDIEAYLHELATVKGRQVVANQRVITGESA